VIVNGWTLLFHEAVLDQLTKLVDAATRAQKSDPKSYTSNPNVKLFAAVAKLMLEVVPGDPSRPEYRQGNTLGQEYRHWFRVKFLGRFRLFFRYDSRAKLIVYAWVNDERTLRQSGGRNDPCEVFRRRLDAGNPPNNWASLVKAAAKLPPDLASHLHSKD
jgi:toxin YhaV